MPYDPEFIAGHVISLPTPSDRVMALAFEEDYIHQDRKRCQERMALPLFFCIVIAQRSLCDVVTYLFF